MPADTLLAVSLTRSDPPLAEQVAAARRAGADLIELRVDCIGDDQAVETLLRRPHAVPFILTVRSAEEGGRWEGDEDQRIVLLERLGLHWPGLVDVEHAAWLRSPHLRLRIGRLCGLEEASSGKHEGTALRPPRWRGRFGEPRKRETGKMRVAGQGPDPRRHEGAGPTLPPANRLILSQHDLGGTPQNLDAVFDRLSASPASIVKAVFAAGDALDSCRVLEQLHRRRDQRRTIALALGEAGLLTRVLARKFGGFLTFAALQPGTESAPGQPTISELRKVYRWDSVNPGTRVFGVIGWPLTHSLSPRLHNAAMAAEGIDGVYLPLPVRPAHADLAAFLDYVTDNDWLDCAGFSLTIPHKEHVLRWLEARGHPVGQTARRCRAVNTLVRASDGGWRGENTDAPGALHALETLPELARGRLNGRTVDLLGAGGAARAIAAALVERGCRVTVYNRCAERARTLAQQLGCRWKAWEQRSSGTGQILINCTSVGMTPDPESSPVPTNRLRAGTAVFDVIYNPAETRLLREARARGCRVISGVEMFIAQAAEQYTLWHGHAAPLEKLREALRSAL